MAVYYVDFNAAEGGKGLACEDPINKVGFEKSGDRVLFRRGSVFHTWISARDGVYYGAYGEGENPVFSGSVNLSSPDMWECAGENIWRCTAVTQTDAANFVFDHGKSFGTLRWTKEDLSENGDFYDERCKNPYEPWEKENGALYLYCKGNPAEVYEDIECVQKASVWLMEVANHMTVENITFMNSGVHAIAGGRGGRNVTIRNCRFLNIGGSVWSKPLKIRFGNAVEFWNVAENVLVENCEFDQIYDSCVTHQGGDNCQVPVNIVFRGNRFSNYGMGAYECRDRMPAGGVFSGNICRNAGCGFAMQGDTNPRKSEIWPQPMGHHIFIWKIESPSEGGRLLIENNLFGDAPCGAAVYSIIDPEAEKQITFCDNQYEGDFLIPDRLSGEA